MGDGQGSGVEKEISHFSQEVLKERVMHFIHFSTMIILSFCVVIIMSMNSGVNILQKEKT